MSIWYDGENLNMYKGDFGKITFLGLPCDKNYRAYFAVKSIATNEIVLETYSNIDRYWGNVNGEEIEYLDGETTEQYEARCEELAQLNPPEAYRLGKAEIILLPSMTDKLQILRNQETAKYYFGLKVCCFDDGDEDTLIPAVIYDEETENFAFEDAPYFIVRQKYVEGILPWNQYCDDMDDAEKHPEDYGLQPLLTPGDGISIDKNNVISTTISHYRLEDLSNVKITNLQNNDVLTYNASQNKWVNEQGSSPSPGDIDGGHADASSSQTIDGGNA